MTKTASTIIGVVLILAVGAFVYSQKIQSDRAQQVQQAVSQKPLAQQGTITAAAIAMHSSYTSCWSSINGNVYDLTSWIPQHPGGPQAILQLCGTDGSAKFNAQHGGQALQAKILAGFKIGIITP